MERKLLSYSEAATWLQIAPITLRRLVMLRKVPFYKIGKSVRFDPDEILRLARREVIA